MALFSLLMAILADRLKLLPESWQFDAILARFHQRLWRDDFTAAQSEGGAAAETSTDTDRDTDTGIASGSYNNAGKVADARMLQALLLPALLVLAALWFSQGLLFGVVTLAIWVTVAMACFSHLDQRNAFKKYIQAACRGDVQACYRHGAEMDCSASLNAVSAPDLGLKVGQSVAWINYRYYGAVALYLLLLGPVGAVLYCTVRFYDKKASGAGVTLPYVDSLLTVLDWLPARLVAFGYLLTGQFRSGFGRWRKLAFDASTPARRLITETATEAETIPEASSAPVCLQPTLVLLGLSKRNFVLLLTLSALLTIFGVLG
ncbi:beta-lactamase regulator AmpE [Shewanella sp. JM162201]|uniref:Beta-lactamase regulator AmpE n=1 Tax=Shewanella jiangmenensis TaxID=2837387 RepID=A0ABS5V255_9GAMM|nr:beta-lactamase regulator AmpE [Shewanella jiangmenensis]MBT1444005.1 beta-lactamase regulator AmpE [Shewanella jiangmenensis]